jgi:hypothetical protein
MLHEHYVNVRVCFLPLLLLLLLLLVLLLLPATQYCWDQFHEFLATVLVEKKVVLRLVCNEQATSAS